MTETNTEKQAMPVKAPKDAKRKDFLGIYKANKNKNGAAAQLKLANDKSCLFLELARQVDDMKSAAPYDWKNTKILVKLGHTDIGKLLALFSGSLPRPEKEGEPDLKLYHQTEKGTKVINIKRQHNGYYLEASSSDKATKANIKVALPISFDEAELLLIALRTGFSRILAW
jgi:hypothetical protein